jgi:short subunit dehydrogenase-like uncharacterized protein
MVTVWHQVSASLIGFKKESMRLKIAGIEIVELEQGELDGLAGKTRLIINGIGPYHLYSSPVIEACAKDGNSLCWLVSFRSFHVYICL